MTLSLAATGLLLLAAAVYAFRLWAFPFGPCWWCKADGRNAAGYCNACAGSGRRVRLGRRLYHAARRNHTK